MSTETGSGSLAARRAVLGARSDATRTGSSGAARPLPKATLFQLVFMTYAVICSGAYGLEEMVSASGPGMALLTIAALAVVWAAPVSLAVAELSARFPVEGGYYRWARMAFGDFVGYTAGWLVWLSVFTTNAAFAVLFASYLRHWFAGMSPAAHFLVAAGLVWVATALNYRGIRLVGNTSVVLTVLIFLPFLAMTLLGLLQWRHNPFEPFIHPEKGTLAAFGDGLLIAIWLYSGFEKLSVNAEEIENPSRAFPLALAVVVPLVAASYTIPTFAALAANGDWSAWSESYFSAAAQRIGGPLLGGAMAAGGLVSNFCLLMVTILGQSRLPMVLAEDGFFPAAFRRTHPRFGTPVVSLIVGALVLTGLCGIRFAKLAGIFALVQALAYVLIYASLYRLRSRSDPAGAQPSGSAPFRIPLEGPGLALMVAPSVVLAVVVVVQSVWHDGGFDSTQAVVDAFVLLSGPLTYLILRKRR